MEVRLASFERDENEVWEIFRRVIETGDTYVFEPETPRSELRKLWFADYMKTYVAEDEGAILGTYILKPNHTGLGSHVANGSYMVHPKAQGKGAGKAMCEHSLREAKKLGYRAMQFNLVVSTNVGAVKLWEKFGFEIIGTIPGAFKHKAIEFVDAHIMYRTL